MTAAKKQEQGSVLIRRYSPPSKVYSPFRFGASTLFLIWQETEAWSSSQLTALASGWRSG